MISSNSLSLLFDGDYNFGELTVVLLLILFRGFIELFVICIYHFFFFRRYDNGVGV